MDIPSLFMIPSAVSSGKVHSVFPNSTDADFDFNRDSDATRVNSEGLIERVGYYGSELASQPINLTNDFIANSGGVIVDADTFTTSGSSLDGIKSNTSVFSLTVGKTYKIDIQGNTTSSGFTLGNISASGNEYGSGFGVHTFVSQNTQLWIRQNTEGTTNITSLSVVEVTGDRARLNYEIEGGLVNTKPSLLLEPQSTNLITYSEDFTNAYFNKFNSNITSNFDIAPNGTKTANKFFSDTNNSAHTFYVFQTVSANAFTFSLFVKKLENKYIQIQLGSNFTDTHSNINLETGVVEVQSGHTTKVEEYNNGWYKISATATSSGTSGYFGLALIKTANASRGASFQGDNKSGVLIWGGQFEQQSYATSYITTNGSTQTRAAETCNGAGTSSILPSEEGILYAEIARPVNDSVIRSIALSDGSASDFVLIQYYNNNIGVVVKVGSATHMHHLQFLIHYVKFNKIGVAWKLNKFQGVC
jgi:hypothetical protein